MAGINMDSIMKKVNAYAKSSDGKERMDAKIGDMRKGKSGATAGGDYVATFKDMDDAANDMENTARRVAQSHHLPDSVLDHFDSLTHGKPYIDHDGRYRVDIWFQDNLYRPSLVIASGPRKGQHTGDGIDNIVSLFDTGYHARERVWGVWPGHEELGVIGSRVTRDPIGFMSEAAGDFNREKFGGKYHVIAIIPESDSDTDFYIK